MKTHERVIEFLSTVLLIGAGLLGGLITTLDFIGTDFQNGIWQWVKGPEPIIYLTVAALAVAVGLERVIRFQRISLQLETIDAKTSANSEKMLHLLQARIPINGMCQES